MKKPHAPKTPQQAAAPQGQESPPVGAGLRAYLYVTSGITGAAVMIVEILGAKLLSPYVGTSHFVWTAQIAVTLVALACGYYAGGRLVDRSPRLGRLYSSILVAAAWLCVTIAVREWVAYRFLTLPLALGSLLASIVLFFVPLFLLAMTGPFLVRMLTSSVREVGRKVGRLNAISTGGSFLGTMLIGYLLIPLLPNSVTMYGTAALLAVLSLSYIVVWGRKPGPKAAAGALAALALAGGLWGVRSEGTRISSMAELIRGNSAFGLLQVLQDKGHPYRYFLNDYLIQNTYDVEQGRSISMFTYMLEGLARAYTPRLRSVLCIGMGVGIVPRDLAQDGAEVDVVEINPAVVPLAVRYFDLQPGAFRLFIGDGRTFLGTAGRRYDAVILDAFLGDSSPSHLMSREAFTAIKGVLEPDGVLVINTFAEYGAVRDFFAASLYKTLQSVFASVRIHGSREENSLFVASPRPELSIMREPQYAQVHPQALSQVREAYAATWQPDSSPGIVLTDDYNPVEYYDAANREKMRRSLALSMRPQ